MVSCFEEWNGLNFDFCLRQDFSQAKPINKVDNVCDVAAIASLFKYIEGDYVSETYECSSYSRVRIFKRQGNKLFLEMILEGDTLNTNFLVARFSK